MVSETRKLEGLSKQIEQYEGHLKMVQVEANNAAARRDQARSEAEAMRVASLKDKERVDAEIAARYEKISQDEKAIASIKDVMEGARHDLSKQRNDLASKETGLEMERRKLAVDRARVDAYLQEIRKLSQGW